MALSFLGRYSMELQKLIILCVLSYIYAYQYQTFPSTAGTLSLKLRSAFPSLTQHPVHHDNCVFNDAPLVVPPSRITLTINLSLDEEKRALQF